MRCMEHTQGVVSVENTVYFYRKHRSTPVERLRMRWKTATYRPLVLWKNFPLSLAAPMIAYTFVLDLLKMGYEVFSNYET